MRHIHTEDDRIAEHVACQHCGYDRFGTLANGACPECGRHGCTRHFEQRRRLRHLAGAVLALSMLQFGLAVGVRSYFAWYGISMRDFAAVGASQPSSPQGLRAAPFLGTMVHSTNALCCGSPILIVLTLAMCLLSLRFGETRGTRLLLVAMLLLFAAAWLGFQQSAVLPCQ